MNAGSVLHPFGPQSARIAALFWPMLWVAVGVCLAVYVALLWASFRRRPASAGAELALDMDKERRMGRLVSGLVALTAVTLLGFLVADYSVGRAMTTKPTEKPVVIELIGHQWWWEVNYEDSVSSRRVSTANEIHIPVGRPIIMRMTSRDVIHSFWIPNLTGKRDLIPGHGSSIWFRADRAGVYGGQCAEFCGHQHAKMSLKVFAEPEYNFRQWYQNQLASHTTPADSLKARGQQVFLTNSCALCHTISGTPSGGRNGPVLSHLMTRTTIAAGSLPNTRGNLAGWIVDPQGIKPGAKMPSNQLSSADLQALLAYLESLQ